MGQTVSKAVETKKSTTHTQSGARRSPLHATWGENKNWKQSTSPTGGIRPVILSWYPFTAREFRAGFLPTRQKIESSTPIFRTNRYGEKRNCGPVLPMYPDLRIALLQEVKGNERRMRRKKENKENRQNEQVRHTTRHTNKPNHTENKAILLRGVVHSNGGREKLDKEHPRLRLSVRYFSLAFFPRCYSLPLPPSRLGVHKPLSPLRHPRMLRYSPLHLRCFRPK